MSSRSWSVGAGSPKRPLFSPSTAAPVPPPPLSSNRSGKAPATSPPTSGLPIPAAIQFQAEHDWPRARQECHELVRYARQAITDLTGLEPICPDSREWYAQMATIPPPACDLDELKRRLYDEYRVEVPIITWSGRQFVRVSVQGYNTREDVAALVNALAVLLPEISR